MAGESLERGPDGRYLKGHPPSGGRPVGAANKITQSLREQVLEGLSDIPAFVKELKRDYYPPAAAGLLARLMPPAENAENTPQGGTVIINILPIRSGTYVGPIDPSFERAVGKRPPELRLVVSNSGLEEEVALIDDTPIDDDPNPPA